MTSRPDAGTVDALRRQLTARLAAAFAARGCDDDPARDARLLLAHALGRAPADLILAGDAAVGAAAADAAERLVERRAAGEPVARITGEKEFWSLPFRLSPATLVPRPDTETVVEAALRHVDAAGRRRAPLTIVDLGTGSGAILIALLTELPQAFGIGIDRSPEAAATARGNARRLGVAGRAAFMAGDWARAVRPGAADLVVANPPYIATGEIPSLALEVRAHDPHLSLDGGDDGLDSCRAVIGDLDRLMAPGGAAFIEVGGGQMAAVRRLAGATGFDVRAVRDLAGTERVAALARPANGDAETAETRPEPKIGLGNLARTR